MDKAETHILVACIIWFSAFSGFLCSYLCSGSPRILSMGNTFGGGVLLAAGLVHLANDSFNYFLKVPDNSWAKADFPWAPLFISLGFLTTLFIEEGVLHILTHNHEGHGPLSEPLLQDYRSPQNPKLTEMYSGNSNGLPDKITAAKAPYTKEATISERNDPRVDVSSRRQSYNFVTIVQNPPKPDVTRYSLASDRKSRISSVSKAMLVHATQPIAKPGHDHDHGAGKIIEGGSIAVALVFLCAISCHSFISGLGVGAMTGNELWSGMIAVMAHKGLASFTLATCFIKEGASNCVLLCYMTFFSLVTPLGILIGSTLASNTGPETEGVLIGLAAGSFIYIGILEVISKELEEESDKMYKLLLLILGWGLMTMLAIWV